MDEMLCEFWDIPRNYCAHCLNHKADWEKDKPRGNAHSYRD